MDGPRLRCNREEPCQNCVARNESSDCRYKSSRHAAAQRQALPDDDKHQMQQRINRLEALVKRLVAPLQDIPNVDVVFTENNFTPETSSVLSPRASDRSDERGLVTPMTDIDGHHSVYKGRDDWFEVLQEVSHIRPNYFAFHTGSNVNLPMY